MSCFDVVYHQSTHHPGGGGGGGYLAYQRSTPNSPLKKRCRLDPDLHQVGGLSSSAADGLSYYDRGVLSFPGTVDTALKPDPLTSAANPSAGGHSSSRSSGAASSFSSALTSPSASSSTSPSTSSSASSCAVASSTRTSSSSTSSVVVALKCELMTSSSNGDDDDVAQQPVMTQPIGGNGLLLTYFSEDIDTNIDNHFHRALRLAQQQHGGHQRLMGRFSAAAASSVIAESKSQGSSSCCRQESSPLSQRSFPASFWNTVSCSSSSSVCPSSSTSSSTSSSSYHPSNGSWSSLMVSPKADPLAAAFTVSPNPSDPYHLNAHFASSAAAASPPGALGPLHQDPWNPYAFCPPPPPSQSGYRRYRHSIHEFSFSSDSPCSLSAAAAAAGGHFGSSGMRYKSLLNGSASSSSARDDPKSHAAVAADVWRSRCYGCADVTGSHIATGFTLSGDIEVTQTSLPDASVKDVYWF